MEEAVGDLRSASAADGGCCCGGKGGTGDMGAATGMAIFGCVRYVVRRLRPLGKTCKRMNIITD